jgi:hypothetical protein
MHAYAQSNEFDREFEQGARVRRYSCAYARIDIMISALLYNFSGYIASMRACMLIITHTYIHVNTYIYTRAYVRAISINIYIINKIKVNMHVRMHGLR